MLTPIAVRLGREVGDMRFVGDGARVIGVDEGRDVGLSRTVGDIWRVGDLGKDTVEVNIS